MYVLADHYSFFGYVIEQLFKKWIRNLIWSSLLLYAKSMKEFIWNQDAVH